MTKKGLKIRGDERKGQWDEELQLYCHFFSQFWAQTYNGGNLSIA